MSRKWTLLTLIFFLGSSGTLQANPLDSPGIVYIDGLPCNRACQSYMAWSRPSPARHREESETNVVVPAEAELERMEHAARPRVARQPLPASRPMPRAGMAASNAKPSNTKASHTNQAAAPKLANQEGSSGGHGDSDSGKDVRKDRPRSSGAGAQIGKLRQGGACPGSLHRRGAAHGEPQARGCQARGHQVRDRTSQRSSSPRSPPRRQPRQKLSRRLPRPRSQRCPLRLARLPLRRSGQYRSKL